MNYASLLAPLSTYAIPSHDVHEEGFFQIPLLRNLARLLGKDIVIYDLESTTLIGKTTFGITEVAMLWIPHDGSTMQMRSDLVNPENPIDPVVIGLNGITEEMVQNQPTFSAWMDLFEVAAKQTLAFGYNSTPFDGPGVMRESERYGKRIVFQDTIDLRQTWVNMVRGTENGRKGKLKEVLEILGIVIDGAWHRARFDVLATALITEKMLLHIGITGVLGSPIHALPLPTTNENKIKKVLTPQMISVRDAIKEFGYDRYKIAQETDINVKIVAEIAWDLYNGGDVRIEQIAEKSVQDFLRPHIKGCAERAWIDTETMGRLRPIIDEIRHLPDAKFVDYTQLKVALTTAGLR